jgi:hypothetical protein
MTEREGAPSDRLVAGESDEWPTAGESVRAGERETDPDWQSDRDWQWGDQWPPESDSPSNDDWETHDDWPPNGDWDWTELPYDEPAWASTAASPPHRPWYRRPGFLIGVIITALVALVVASVLLLTRSTFDEQDTERDEVRLKPTIRTSTEPTQNSTPSEETEPAPEPQPAPVGPTAGGAIGEQNPATPPRPRTNVTRTPMSFTPGGG